MINLRWVVTDDISNMTLDEFDYSPVYVGIWGHFEMTINYKECGGWWPNKAADLSLEGEDDILYWIDQLYRALKAVKKGEDYEMRLFSMNLRKYKFHLGQKLQISYIKVPADELNWTEEVPDELDWAEEIEMQEFEEEIRNNRNRFVEYIKKENPELLKSEGMKELLNE